ncbi:MAG: hypothetical protein DWB45_13605 [Xanthomonadales bacterium]|nr:MAG: hypothetical protein F9K31_01400 [Dokdonella sp.]MBC6943735.1 hypothetical protein [Xanthomonadales bacterium]
MTPVYVLTAWIATALLGSGTWIAIAGWPRDSAARWCALGGGWILGALLGGVGVRVLGASDLTGVVAVAAGAAAVGLLLWGGAWRLRGRAPVALATRMPPIEAHRGERIWIALLLALLAWRGVLILDDVLLHPVLPWDAWAVWLAKAKAWVLAGRIDASVPYASWVAQAAAPERTGVAWMYPELVPWMAVWFAAGTHWIEPLVGLVWFGLGVALLVLHYGQWRALGVSRAMACVGVYALGSLPLLDAHVALGGYADLWIAAVLSLGAHAWLRWSSLGERRQIGLIVVAMVLLPLLKLEGSIWSIVLGMACAFRLLPRRLRARRFAWIAAAVAATVVVCIAFGLPWIAMARRYLDSGRLFDGGQIAASALSLASALWAQWNWNLLWVALPGVLVWNARCWSASPTTRRLVALVALPLLVMLGLFLFTTAARYAQSYSAVNRLLLQITPLLVSVLVLALRPPDGVAARGASQSGASCASASS